MVVFQHRTVVVQHGRFRAGHDVEAVGRSRVLEIVNYRRYYRGENLQIAQPILSDYDATLITVTRTFSQYTISH